MSSSSNTPEPLDPSFQLKLPTFEGPLDLLLHLCQKHELDIVNLPVAFVTERYLDYIRLMERLDLDIASEYLVMAATLAHIKSKLLLPQDPEAQADEGEEGEEIDPRQELIRRLLEYQKYKAAAAELGARGVAGRDVFLRGMEAPEASGPAPLAGIGLFKLLDAFQGVLKRAKADLAFQITAEGVSIQDRMTQLTDTLRTKRRCTFDELFADAKTIYDVVVTFLAILEMAKRRLASVYQSEPIAPIHLEYRVLDAEEETAGASVDEGGASVGDGGASVGEGGGDVVESVPREEEVVAAERIEVAHEAGIEPLPEEIDERLESEPGVALESSLAPAENESAIEADLAPEVHEAIEATIDPVEAPIAPAGEPSGAPPDVAEAPLDPDEGGAHDSPPAEPGAEPEDDR